VKKKETRPVFLNLVAMQFPLTAISSILHRVSGVLIFCAFLLFLPLMYYSLESIESFIWTVQFLDFWFIKLVLWGFLVSLFYHVYSGIRHLLMDKGFFEESMLSGNRSAQVVFIVTIATAIYFGVLLW